MAIDNKITLQEIRELILGYLYGRGYQDDHIKEQLENVTKMFGKKYNNYDRGNGLSKQSYYSDITGKGN